MRKASTIEGLARRAKEASRTLARTPTAVKDKALREAARAIRRTSGSILRVNRSEVAAARAAGKPAAFLDRLALDEKRVESIAQGLLRVAGLPDPVGKTEEFSLRPNGLRIRKMRVPLGVIAVIYESRPGVTADAAGLCLKSGNACLLRGGGEAARTNALIAGALAAGLKAAGLPAGSVGFLRDRDRSALRRLLAFEGLIDLVIPRGGPGLTLMVRRESMIPVLSHDKGLCHTFVDASADPAMASDICFNAKAERPGVCNAMETLLVHEKVAARFLPELAGRYRAAGVELRGCPKTRRILPGIKRACARDWDTEYLGPVLSIKVVSSFKEALGHIARHGSGLAEAIVTRDAELGRRFQREVDSGAVFVNASTRFTDGGEFGLGAEMGISTQKLHARGPVGLEGLTCEKFVVTGSGQIRESRA